MRSGTMRLVAGIRFVGGSKHNQLLNVREGREWILIPIPQEPCLYLDDELPMPPPTLEVETYRLTLIRSAAGAVYAEYHVQGCDCLLCQDEGDPASWILTHREVWEAHQYCQHEFRYLVMTAARHCPRLDRLAKKLGF